MSNQCCGAGSKTPWHAPLTGLLPWACLGILGLLLAGWPALADPLATQYSPTAPAQATSPTGPTVDDALRLIGEAEKAYQGVRDYTCLFIKRERLRGQVQPDNLIAMKVRSQPFSVYMRWLGPRELVGQQACYVAGQNQGLMRVHATGIRGIAGFVSLDPNDPRVMQNSRHTITEAGIGNLIQRYRQRWEMERQLNKTVVHIGDYIYNQSPCTRVEMIHPDNSSGKYYAYRNVMYFDKATHLPIRVESYDWPKPGSPAGGDFLESYSYVQMRFNVGLGNDSFNY